MAADMHIHTSYSSAPELTPRKVVSDVLDYNKSHPERLDIVAITDHINLGGIEETRKLAYGSVRVMSGLEIKTRMPFGIKGDVLGYGVDNKKEISSYVDDLRQRQQNWYMAVLEKLDPLDVHIEKGWLNTAGLVDERHLAEVIAEKGYAKGWEDAMKKYLSPGSPGYVDLEPPQAVEVIGILNANDAVTVLAHPGILGSEMNNVIDYLARLPKQERIMAIEWIHPAHSESVKENIKSSAEKFDLAMLGGSDAHGEGSRYPRNIGESVLPDAYVQKLIKRFNW